MSLIPIAGTTPIEDPSYRYKMPRIVAKVEGRGNGIKTVICNMKEVADALHRQPAEVTKFFGCDLGAQTSYRDDNEKSIVNGNHSAQTLQQLLTRYIQTFVLCGTCLLPETMYKIKGGMIHQKCDACGSKTLCDMSHKLTTFILNAHKKADKDAKKDKKDKKEARDKEREAAGGAAIDEDSPEKKEKKEKKDKKDKDKKDKKKEKKEKKKDKEGAEAGAGAEANGDTDEVVATMDNLSIEDALALEASIERTKAYLAKNPEATPTQVLEELRMISTLNGLPVEERVFVFVCAAFDGECVKSKGVERYADVLKGLMLKVDEAAYQRRLLGVMEFLCGVKHPELRRFFPVLLKQLYEEGVVEEAVFVEWDEEEGQRTEYTRREVNHDMVLALRGEADKFMTWLKEAESDDDSEEEDGDSEEDGSDEDSDA